MEQLEKKSLLSESVTEALEGTGFHSIEEINKFLITFGDAEQLPGERDDEYAARQELIVDLKNLRVLLEESQ